MNVKYSKQGDYYIPNIVAPENAKGFILSKYVRAYKSNSTSIKFDYTGNSDALIYALKYCNSFSKRPKILIEADRDIQASELSKAIQQYEGDVEIIKK